MTLQLWIYYEYALVSLNLILFTAAVIRPYASALSSSVTALDEAPLYVAGTLNNFADNKN